MARSRSLAGDLVELVALFPWWVGVALAGVSHVGLSVLAFEPSVSKGAGVPMPTILAMVADALRWILPLVFIGGALASAIGRARRAKLLATARANGRAAVTGMSWREFELLVGEAFRRKGYVVAETGGRGADGGVDLILRRHGEIALVQCKHWKAGRVGLPTVREFLGAMTAHKATKGWVIASGRFTTQAVEFARQHRIELVDGEALPLLIGSSETRRDAPVLSGKTTTRESPACPHCGAAMVLRTARRGANVGQSFWGCARFPECRGTQAAGERN